MAKPAIGTVVEADFGSGPEYALLVKTGADKDTLIPLGKGEQVGYREPEDRDKEGSGRTWWNARGTLG
jgi:hypothetical protein